MLGWTSNSTARSRRASRRCDHRSQLSLTPLEGRDQPSIATVAYVDSGPAAGVFTRGFVAEGRIGNNAANGTHEVDVGRSTAGPFVAAEVANGAWTKAPTPFTFTFDDDTGIATFTSGTRTVTSSGLSFAGLIGEDTMTLRTVANVAGSSSRLTDLRLSVGGGVFVDVPNPDGSAGPASTGSAHAGSPDQDVLQIVGCRCAADSR